MKARHVVARAVVVGLSAFAFCLGLALGTTACCGTSPPEPIELVPGTYMIVRSDDRPELIGGTLDMRAEGLTIHYERDGVEWTVEYMVDLE